jgi:hypothetical protein
MEVHKYVHKTLQFSAYEIRVEIDLEREIQNVNMEPSILLFYESQWRIQKFLLVGAKK